MSEETNQFREGDRAEYLAHYLLSYFGTSVAVPRQEDQGIDFLCTLESLTQGDLPTFEHPLYIQVKLGEPKKVEYGGITTGGKWKKHPVKWLLNLDLPLIIAFADTKKQELTLYQTSPRWFIHFETLGKGGPPPFKINVFPGESSPTWPKKRRSPSPSAKKIKAADGHVWRCDVGNPLETIRLNELGDPVRRETIATALKKYVEMERKSIAHGLLGTTWAYWATDLGQQDYPFRLAFVIENENFPLENSKLFFKELTPILCSLLLRLKAESDEETLTEAINLFKKLGWRLDYPSYLRNLMEEWIVELKGAP